MNTPLTLLHIIGHSIDSFVRRNRCLINPKKWRGYQNWCLQQNKTLPEHKPLVIFKLSDSRIDGPQGRRFYCLFIFFLRAGYHPVIVEKYRFLVTRHLPYKKLFMQEQFSLIPTLNVRCNKAILITDKKPSKAIKDQYTKIIYTDFRSDYAESDHSFPMPFPMYPEIYANKEDLRLADLRKQPKLWKIFFGGDSGSDKYSKNSMRKIYKKIPRANVLSSLRKSLPKELWRELQSQSALNTQLDTMFPGVVNFNKRHCQISPEKWLATMAKSSFFIACPGVRYPMSHNIIEALAVGTIPITQYPELFFPPLTAGKNCLTFNNEEELLEVVLQAINMSDHKKKTMSEEAVDYYNTYLQPQAVIKNLLQFSPHVIPLRLLPFLKSGGGFA